MWREGGYEMFLLFDLSGIAGADLDLLVECASALELIGRDLTTATSS